MPIYEYKCSKCAETFELLQRSGEKAVCPKCGSQKLTKLLSVFSSLSTVSAMPKCEGRTAACAPDKCRSGACGVGRLED